MYFPRISFNDVKEMIKNILPFTTYEQRKRLAELQNEAEKGSNEIRKQLYDEIHKIYDEQGRAFAQQSSQNTLSKAPEINQFCPNSRSGTVAVQNPYQHSQRHPQNYSSGNYPPQSLKMPKTKEDKAYMNAMTTQNKIRAEIASSSRQNFSYQQKHPRMMPPVPSPQYYSPKKDESIEIEDNYDVEKFVRKQEAMRAENERMIEQQKAEFEMQRLREEERIKKYLEANTNFNSTAHLPSVYELPKASPLPVLSNNVSTFADDLAAILKKDRKPDPRDSPPEPYSKTSFIDTENPKNTRFPVNASTKNPEIKNMEIENTSNFGQQKIEVIPKNDKIKIGIMGLNGAGKSYLISALTNNAFKDLGNKKRIEYGQNCTFFEIHHPNYGFVSNQPEAIKAKCQEYFNQIQVNNLTCLLNVINGDLREEDIFATQLALQAGIQFIIIRSKSDEWLDGSYQNNITDQNKTAFSEKDKKYVREIAKKIDEEVAKCPIFNISALSLYNISTKTKRATIMQKYLIDELALIEYLEGFGICFDALKNNIMEALNKDQISNKESSAQSSSKHFTAEKHEGKIDILFVGRIGTGKSALIDALQGMKESDKNSVTKLNACTIQNLKIAEFSYQEPTIFPKIIEQLKHYILHQLKRIYLVIGDAVGELDVKLTKFMVNEKLPLTILLTKTDLHIDSITERRGFEQHDLEDYYNHRKQSAHLEIAKLVKNTDQLDLFVISSLVIRNLVTNTDKFLQYACDDRNFLSQWTELF